MDCHCRNMYQCQMLDGIIILCMRNPSMLHDNRQGFVVDCLNCCHVSFLVCLAVFHLTFDTSVGKYHIGIFVLRGPRVMLSNVRFWALVVLEFIFWCYPSE